MKKLYILLAETSILFTAACKKDGSAGGSNLAAQLCYLLKRNKKELERTGKKKLNI